MKKTTKAYLFGASVAVLTFFLFTGAPVADVVTNCTALGYSKNSSFAFTPQATTDLSCPFSAVYKTRFGTTFCDTNFYQSTSCPSHANCLSCRNFFTVSSCQEGYELTHDYKCAIETYDCRSLKTKVGDFIYTDYSCSSGSKNPRTDKTVKGIMLDPQHKYAVVKDDSFLNDGDYFAGTYIPEPYDYGTNDPRMSTFDGRTLSQFLYEEQNQAGGALEWCIDGYGGWIPSYNEYYDLFHNYHLNNPATLQLSDTEYYWTSDISGDDANIWLFRYDDYDNPISEAIWDDYHPYICAFRY